MKAPFVSVLCLLAVALTAAAQTGPKSPLYLTYTQAGNLYDIAVVQGNTITTFPEAYNPGVEVPIAVFGDVRTTGYVSNSALGGQYSLGGTPTGTTYTLPGAIAGGAYDSTSDGSHNYLVDYLDGGVYQTARDFSNPVLLFGSSAGLLGITYDRSNNSLWITPFEGSTVTDYSLSGTVLSTFTIAGITPGGLAWDPADGTLWMAEGYSGDLVQYSTAGVLLSTGPYVGYTLGGEFNLATPEPGTVIMFGSGMLGLAGVVRRKIKL
jgi:PEP-CTERM motif